MFAARSLILSFLALGQLGSLAACGSKAAPAQNTTTQPSTSGAEDTKALCVKMFTRSRECTSDFIPALVDARARHDTPPGIAEQVKTNRDAVIAEAMKEWENDSKDDAIQGMCDKISTDPAMSEGSSEANGCMAKTSCPEFVACTMPMHEKHFAK
jgi:predicted small lipoprotein YifL